MPDTPLPSSAVSLRGTLRVLRRRLWLIALCTLVVPVSVLAYSLAQQKEYRASASLLFRDSGLASLVDPSQAVAARQPDDTATGTNLGLAGLDVVASATARKLGVPSGDVAGKVKVEPVPSSDLATVNATDTQPAAAATLANAYAREFIRRQRASDRAEVARAQSAVQARLKSIQAGLASLQRLQGKGPAALRSERRAERQTLVQERGTLLKRQGQLRSLEGLVTGNVELVQPATAPSAPIAPKTRRDTAIGVGLGLVLGICLALLFEMLDRRLRDASEVSELVDLPLLGAIPHSKALAERPPRSSVPTAESDAFHMLRARLRYYNEDRELGSVLITSAGSRDGKTTVAWNLAVVSAQAGQKVLLLEADLRRPSLAARLRVPADVGAIDVLRGTARLGDVLKEVVVGSESNDSNGPCTLDLVLAGAVGGPVTGLMESERMDGLVREAQEHYDVVVIDTPPMSVVPDAIALMDKVGGVVVVTRLGRTTRDAVTFLSSQLTHIRAPALGIVVNSITRQDGYYGATPAAPSSRRSAGLPADEAPVGR